MRGICYAVAVGGSVDMFILYRGVSLRTFGEADSAEECGDEVLHTLPIEPSQDDFERMKQDVLDGFDPGCSLSNLLASFGLSISF